MGWREERRRDGQSSWVSTATVLDCVVRMYVEWTGGWYGDGWLRRQRRTTYYSSHGRRLRGDVGQRRRAAHVIAKGEVEMRHA